MLAEGALQRRLLFILGEFTVAGTGSAVARALPHRLAFRRDDAAVVRERADGQIAKDRVVTVRRPLIKDRTFHLEPIQRDAGAGVDGARAR
jgi:hypothetical protein